MKVILINKMKNDYGYEVWAFKQINGEWNTKDGLNAAYSAQEVAEYITANYYRGWIVAQVLAN